MGFFSKLKNTLTGGWADVTLDAPGGRRGDSIAVTVRVRMKGEPIAISRVYVRLTCAEIIDIPGYQIPAAGTTASATPGRDRVDIHARESLLDQDSTLAPAQTLAANQEYEFKGRIEIPNTCPPSFGGRHARIEWQVLAGLDMKGNDPDSGWRTISVS